ncbi:hypothetical protein TI04_04340, partial [Achromatium sp. WMS2]
MRLPHRVTKSVAKAQGRNREVKLKEGGGGRQRHDRTNRNRQRGRVWAMSVLGNAKSNCHRKTHQVEPDGTGRKYMFLLGEILRARAIKKSAEAIVALILA